LNFNHIIDRKGTYCTQWDYVQDRFGEEGLLPFTISDTDFAIPDVVMSSLRKRMEHPIFGYTRWNHSEFKSSVMKWFSDRFQTEVNSEWLAYSPTVIYSVSKLIELKSQLGEGVVIQTPAYDAFFKVIKENQRKIVENPLIYQDGTYHIDFGGLEETLAQENNKILLLCSPHNPTGRIWTEEELTKIANLCRKYDVFVISDEIHMDILRKGKKHIPFINFMEENCALVTSGSKTFNFPGLVFSYAIIPDEDLQSKFLLQLKSRDGLSSPSILGLEATMSAYENCEDWVDKLNQYLDENHQLVHHFFEEKFPEIHVMSSEATYLSWIDISGVGLSMDHLQELLVHVGEVAIMDGTIYGGNGEQFIRLNIGCTKKKLTEGLHRFEKALSHK
jgi:cystathionine beta-lyase